jgi:hypothetical protein
MTIDRKTYTSTSFLATNSVIFLFFVFGVAKHGRFLSEEFYRSLSEPLFRCQEKNGKCHLF